MIGGMGEALNRSFNIYGLCYTSPKYNMGIGLLLNKCPLKRSYNIILYRNITITHRFVYLSAHISIGPLSLRVAADGTSSITIISQGIPFCLW